MAAIGAEIAPDPIQAAEFPLALFTSADARTDQAGYLDWAWLAPVRRDLRAQLGPVIPVALLFAVELAQQWCP